MRSKDKFECSICGQECFHDRYPRIMLYACNETEVVICERCNIADGIKNNKIQAMQGRIDISRIRGGFYNG